MSTELMDILSQFGPLAVVLIAAGTIVAAVISAIKAWAVAWFNARAARQLAVDAAHREYRKEYCGAIIRVTHVVDVVAARITHSLGTSMDAGIPMGRDDAAPIAAYARAQLATLGPLEWRLVRPSDSALYQALREAARAEEFLASALRDLEMALASEAVHDFAPHRRPLVIAARKVSQATVWVDLAVEAYTFGLRPAKRRLMREMNRSGSKAE